MFIENDLTKTGQKVFIGECVQGNRKKLLIVSDNTLAADWLGKFFKNLGRSSAKAGNKSTKECFEKTQRALENGSKIRSATVCKISNAALSTMAVVMIFDHSGKGFYLGRFVYIFGKKEIYKVLPFCSIRNSYSYRKEIKKEKNWCT